MRILNEVKNERSELNMSKKEVPLDRHRNKLTIMKQMIEDESINTDECVVASTYMNAEFPYLNKKLSVANAMLNRHFNPQYQKQPENRIVFYCFNEKVFNLHSHIYLKTPKHLMFAAVIEKFQQIFARLDDRTNENRKYKFRVHNETIDDQFKFLEYCLKRYDVNNADTFVVI